MWGRSVQHASNQEQLPRGMKLQGQLEDVWNKGKAEHRQAYLNALGQMTMGERVEKNPELHSHLSHGWDVNTPALIQTSAFMA
jgi:hypothetical protein